MNSEHKINRFFLLICTLLLLSLTYLVIIDNIALGKKILYLAFCLTFLYAVISLYFTSVVITKNSIKNVVSFYPFFSKISECNFDEIKKITYNFFVFEESGNFVIQPKNSDKNKTVIISFLIDNKKEIIQKILEKRPDLKLDDWIWERVLNYKIIRKKFLIVSSVIIIICVLTLITQYIQR